ncbi:MAG TPA: hypothetical protein DHW42_05990 [Candidatus Marinimicrobia bacterium]|nr:hypothetical protein [Candidatus Neomarinimicrobiota bacterium]
MVSYLNFKNQQSVFLVLRSKETEDDQTKSKKIKVNKARKLNPFSLHFARAGMVFCLMTVASGIRVPVIVTDRTTTAATTALRLFFAGKLQNGHYSAEYQHDNN